MDFEIIGPVRMLSLSRSGMASAIEFACKKGGATVRLHDGAIHTAEVHWYEAHGIGKREFKLKFPLIS